eukprot:104391-Chlamydomonas_euryale.AAC.1
MCLGLVGLGFPAGERVRGARPSRAAGGRRGTGAPPREARRRPRTRTHRAPRLVPSPSLLVC